MESALRQLAAQPAVELIRRSRLYRTSPWGNPDQPDFINAVAEIACTVGPRALLGILQAIEDHMGRRRGERYGPRLIDLDLLTYRDRHTNTADLTLPHPRMHQRAFVLVPLLELDPDFVIPGRGRADACLRKLDSSQAVEAVAG